MVQFYMDAKEYFSIWFGELGKYETQAKHSKEK